MKYLLGLPLVVALSIPVTLLGGLVVSDYWSWFISPTFGFAPITYLQAVGLTMFVGLFKIGLKTEKYGGDDKDAPLASSIGNIIGYVVFYLLAWGIGFIWSLFI